LYALTIFLIIQIIGIDAVGMQKADITNITNILDFTSINHHLKFWKEKKTNQLYEVRAFANND
jgi:hypothetical protein